MGFAYIFAGVFVFWGQGSHLNPKRHYVRHVKLDFGVFFFPSFLFVLVWVLPIFLQVFSFLGSGQPS